MGSLSREYLEEALTAVKRLLPGWQYAVIRQAAFPRAGGRAAHRPAEKAKTSTVQSLIFDKKKFDAKRAKAWAEENGYDSGKVDETGDSFRLRQEEPGDFQAFRTIELRDGVKAVLGIRGDGKVSKAGDGVMVGLFLSADAASSLVIDGGESPEDMHITLAYLGNRSELPPGFEVPLAEAVARVVRNQPPLRGKISGVGRFNAGEGSDGMDVIHATCDVPGLAEMHTALVKELTSIGLAPSSDHGFDPHITLAYVPRGIGYTLPACGPMALDWDACHVADGALRMQVPFRGRDGLPTAPDSGIHMHALEREEGRTKSDGPHAHIFIMPDGSEAWTEMDGEHQHEIDGDATALRAGEGSGHSHRVRMPDGSMLMTEMSGNHLHQLQVWTTALDGVHIHELVLADGSRITSPTPAKYWEILGRPDQAPQPPITDYDMEPAVELPEGALPTSGPEGASVMFVGAAPSPMDSARGEPLTGSAGQAFRDNYLNPLGLNKAEVAVSHLVPIASKKDPSDIDVARWRSWIGAEIDRVKPRVVVALGHLAKSALGSRATFVLPHPAAFARRGDSGEVERKLKAITKVLTSPRQECTSLINSVVTPIHRGSDGASNRADDTGPGAATVRMAIAKQDRKRQVVYGVVLDPYTVDTQDDWSPPATIESTAHGWLAKSRVIGMEHGGQAVASYPIESYLVPYPSDTDYAAAMRNEPHAAWRIKLGQDRVPSGAWILAVKIDDAETWKRIEAGELDAFSVGGFSERRQVSRGAMPTVRFIDV